MGGKLVMAREEESVLVRIVDAFLIKWDVDKITLVHGLTHMVTATIVAAK